MEILLFGGFLGSGKTSVILSLAKILVKKYMKNEGAEQQKTSLVIIENEVGETGIDDKILKADGLSVRELFSGCICCTLTTELTVALNEIQETLAPEWVIVEATGMAYPHKIAETIQAYGKGIESMKSIVVVDAERWEELTEIIPGLIEGQIRHADLVFLNKIDCMQTEQLEKINAALGILNPTAPIYPVSTSSGIDPAIWKEAVFS